MPQLCSQLDLLLLHGFAGSLEQFLPALELLQKERQRRCAKRRLKIAIPRLLGHRPPSSAELRLLSKLNCDDETDQRTSLQLSRISKDTELSPAELWEQQIQALLPELTRLENSGGILLGYSLGARLGAALHSHGTASKNSRALLLSGRLALETTEQQGERAQQEKHWAERLRQQGLDSFFNEWEQHPVLASQSRSLSKSQLLSQRRQRLSQDPFELAQSFEGLGLAAMPTFPTRQGARQFWFCGGRDSKFKELHRELKAQLSQARFGCIQDAGHNLLLEAPEAVALALLSLGL